MRIGKHKNKEKTDCDGELFFGDMNGNGIRHVLTFYCVKCEKHIEVDKIKMERCRDCVCLVSKNNKWFCDEYNKNCIDIEECGEWEK